jgi:diadenosine tetraphosphate (Ap4A) HIT family hydrolase
MRFAVRAVLLVLTLARPALRADVRGCTCDLSDPATAQVRGCSLCVEAARHPASERIIVLRDNSPAKPNRWLVVPHAAFDGESPLTRMSEAERLELWNAAISKANEVWGTAWGIAMNGDKSRSQCHLHVHIGKLLDGKEDDNGFYVDDAAQLPAIADGTGLWFHPLNGKLHVHSGEATELVLMK